MRLVKIVLWSAFILCVGIPAAFVLFVLGMAAFGVVLGLGMALVGMMIAVLKVALMVILPIALLVWVLNRMSDRARV
jgi:hypothetical protein